jgi:hypothetical protein
MTVRIFIRPRVWKAVCVGVVTELVTGVLPLWLLIHYDVSAHVAWPYLITQLPGILVLLVFGPVVNPENQAWINPTLLVSILALQVYLFSLVAKRVLTKRNPARPS